MTKQQFSRAIRIFVDELSIRAIAERTERLASMNGLIEAMDDTVASIRDDNISYQLLLGRVCGILDEYVSADWDRLLEETYAAYIAQSAESDER
jgi:hypothetical protein